MAEPYRQQVGPQSMTDALRGASPEAFGSQVGAAIERGAGEVQDAMAEARNREKQRVLRSEASQAGVDFARLNGDVAIDVDAAREDPNAPADGAGHVERVTAAARERLDGFLGSIGNPEIRDAYAERGEELISRVRDSEDGWARGQRVAHVVSNARQEDQLYRNQIQTNPDDATFFQTLPAIRTSVAALGLPAAQAEALTRERIGGYAAAYVNGKIEQDPAAALAAIRGHSLDDLLPADQRAHLEDAAQAEIRVREADQRRVQAAAQQALRTDVDMMQRRLTSHDPTITDADLEGLSQRAAAAGLPTDAFDIAKARVMHQVDQQYARPGHEANPVELRAAIGTLDTRIAAAGANASPADVIRRDHIQSLLDARTRALAADPQAGLPGGGQPIEFGNPASERAGIAQARTAERMTGFFQLLPPPQAALMREQIASGPQGRLAAINQLARIGAVDPDAALRAAEQVAPGDATFRHALRVSPAVREMVVQGIDARRTMPNRVVQEDGSTTTVDAVTQGWFAAHVAPSLVRSTPDFVNDTRETALNIYAEMRRRQGASGQDFDEALYGRAVNAALGQRGDRNGNHGGLGSWSWGPRLPNGDAPGVLLPSRMSQQEFEGVMARLPTAREGRHWEGASNGVPSYRGQPVSADVIRNYLVPVAIRDGVYQFEFGGAVLTNEHGLPFELNVYTAQARWPHSAPTMGAPVSDREALGLSGERIGRRH